MEPITARRRHSKFVRHPEQYPLLLKARDLQILSVICSCRFIASDQIAKLVEGNDREILKRLKKLFHHGYVDRLLNPKIRTRLGSERIVYSMTNKGGALLAEQLGLDLARVNWTWKNRSVTQRLIKRTLAISKFRTVLTLAVQKHDRLKLDFWKGQRCIEQNKDLDLIYTVTLMHRGALQNERRRIVPDGFFGLSQAHRQHLLFVEADRSTMTADRFAKRLAAYWSWWTQGECKKKYGVEDFRVLTVTPCLQRRDSLRVAAGTAVPIESASSMFWFACEKDYSVNKPETIFGPIWRTPKDERFHSICE